MDYARNPSRFRCAISCRLSPSSPPLKPYNRSHMQPALSTRIQDGFMAAMRLGGEKPHQGLPGENPAPNQVREVCKFTVLLGMRGQAELNRAGSCCTGKERDTESGNDYFGARYYSSAMGRFMSPDWSAKYEPVPYAKLDNPQTLNLYSYVQNNPLSSFDDDGHATVEIRYTPVAGGLGYHSYLVVTDTNGHQTYFRAGPQPGSLPGSSASSQASGGSSSQSSGSGSSGSNSSNSSNGSSPGSSPGGGGPYGNLTAETGDYVPGTIDYETNPTASVTLISNDLPAAGYNDQLSTYAAALNGANVSYNPFSTNSNAAAAGAAKSLGATVPAAPVRTPGAGTKLPVKVTPLPPAPPPPPPPKPQPHP
jgi:RHS repeat-associated protein